jgi:hypothetical protein
MMPHKNTESDLPPDWQPIVSGNAQLVLSPAEPGRGSALRMDFDFKGAGGFVVARRAIRRAMPEEYAVHFRLRGRGPVNNLELKLVDAAGQNVWRYVQKDLRLPARWKRMKIDSRAIDFAWGPSSGGRLSMLGSMEFAIVAGEGGQGTIWIADVEIEDCTPRERPRASASSELMHFEAANSLGGSGWRPHPEDRRPWINIDFTQARTIGGLVIDWLEHAPASGFRVRVSAGGVHWRTVHRAPAAGGKRSYIYLPDLKTRWIRLQLSEPSAGATVRLQTFEFSRSIHSFWHAVAEGEVRGWHPRWLHNEQSVWTPFGTSNGTHCALMNEDGMVEVDAGSFSIEPMLWIGGRLVTWADVESRQELQDGWMPIPSVQWETEEWRLKITADATPSGTARLRYRFENLTDRFMTGRLFMVVRPFQVTPPWQSFRELGGVSRISDLTTRDGGVCVNGAVLIVPASRPASFGAIRFNEGFIASYLAAGTLPQSTQVHDPFGFATGALGFDIALQSRQSIEHAVHCMPVAAAVAAAIGEPAFDWGARLRTGQWAGNGWIADAIRAALTATAHVLVTRAGPALQPGPRRYTRSWIRDGAMMGAALLRMGHAEEVREFIRWYAPHQRSDGFVPCCVDAQGIDWLVEHDSHGELLALIGDYYRFTADAKFLQECWTFVDKAVGCIAGLLGPDGLLPISVSHEGYLAQPVHSYWDDFWALKGLQEAAHLAREAGHEADSQRWTALAQRLGASLFASIEATRAQRQLEFIPGSIEWADFDPTATANAIYLLDVPDGLNRGAVERTFDKYLVDWRGKRSGAVPWANYTPYEIRIIGALVRLGRRAEALELLRFFLSDRRPLPWNQWPEIAWRDRKAAAHVGDLPHTWIAAEYVLAVRSLFAYEVETDRSLVLAAGLASEWLDGAGVQVSAMPTVYGDLSYSLCRVDEDTLRFEIGSAGAGTVILRPPLDTPLRTVIVDGSPHRVFDADSVTVPHTAAQVICSTKQ